jgi:hypothetical protein
MEKIWEFAPFDIVDYPFLMDFFKEKKQPRLKIAYWIHKGALIRIKKGLYVLGPPYNRGLYRLEILANLIYGPSYISLEYALGHYGLIPERVVEVTSITSGRNKYFETPLGRFSYRHLHPHKYPIGVTYQTLEKGGFLIACKEKALADCVARRTDLHTRSDVEDYILGLRIERSELTKMSLKKMKEIAKIYQSHQIDFLFEILKRYRSHDE